MTKDKLMQEFETKVCPYCKGECTKGIIIAQGEINSIRCVDYEKDEVKGYEKPLSITARQRKSIMGFTQNY